MRLDIHNEIKSSDDVYSSYCNSFRKFTRADPFQRIMANSQNCHPVEDNHLATTVTHTTYDKLLTRDMNKNDNLALTSVGSIKGSKYTPPKRDVFLPERKTFFKAVPDTRRLGQTDREREDAKHNKAINALGQSVNKSLIASLFGKVTPQSIISNVSRATTNQYKHISKTEMRKAVGDALSELLDCDLSDDGKVEEIAAAIGESERALDGGILPDGDDESSTAQKILKTIKGAPKSFASFLKSGGKKVIVPLYNIIKEQLGKVKLENGRVVLPGGISFSLMDVLNIVRGNVSAEEMGLDPSAVSFFSALTSEVFGPDRVVDIPQSAVPGASAVPSALPSASNLVLRLKGKEPSLGPTTSSLSRRVNSILDMARENKDILEERKHDFETDLPEVDLPKSITGLKFPKKEDMVDLTGDLGRKLLKIVRDKKALKKKEEADNWKEIDRRIAEMTERQKRLTEGPSRQAPSRPIKTVEGPKVETSQIVDGNRGREIDVDSIVDRLNKKFEGMQPKSEVMLDDNSVLEMRMEILSMLQKADSIGVPFDNDRDAINDMLDRVKKRPDGKFMGELNKIKDHLANKIRNHINRDEQKDDLDQGRRRGFRLPESRRSLSSPQSVRDLMVSGITKAQAEKIRERGGKIKNWDQMKKALRSETAVQKLKDAGFSFALRDIEDSKLTKGLRRIDEYENSDSDFD